MSPWRAEIPFVFLALVVGAFFGKILGQIGIVLWVCVLIYLARHLFFANRLIIWLRSGKTGQPPDGDGVWEDIYYLIYRLRRRNKRRKKQLIEMLERFRTATAALPDATVVLGPRDEIDWYNEAAERLLGLRRSDIGHKIGNLLRSPKFNQFLHATDFQSTLCIPSPLAENVHLDIRIVPYGEDLRLMVMRDVTQLRFMERVRTDFVANVSHELRTPLTVLKGYLETLRGAEGKVPDSYLKVFLRMEEQTSRMESLVAGLLSLTRLESSAHRLAQDAVDVPVLLSQICEEVQMMGEGAPSVELVLDTDSGVLGAEPELRSAFSNLVVNAIKFTPPAGHVTVHWRDGEEGICLDVKDTGPGIAAPHLPRLTERFYRVDVEGSFGKSGSGLGLAIVKHVLTRHGGELRIESTPGKGSCFTCWFPSAKVVRDLEASPDDLARVG